MLVGFETQPEEDETLPLVQVTGLTGARFATTHLDHLLQWNIFLSFGGHWYVRHCVPLERDTRALLTRQMKKKKICYIRLSRLDLGAFNDSWDFQLCAALCLTHGGWRGHVFNTAETTV